MDKEELDLQYSPSKWSRRFSSSEEVITNHLREISKGSELTKLSIPNECNVRYGDRKGQLLDIFGGSSIPDDSPIFVHIHGGFWQELNKDVSSFLVQPLYKAGVRVIIVGYDLAPTVKLEEIVQEIEEAATYTINLAVKLGARSVTFGGHSAGAHLASMLLSSKCFANLQQTERNIVKGFVLMSGVYDLKPIVNTYVNEAVKLSESDAENLSPMYLKSNLTPEVAKSITVMVVIAEYESVEFHRQSQQYAEKLRQNGFEVRYITIHEVDHFDLVENLQNEDYILTKELIKF